MLMMLICWAEAYIVKKKNIEALVVASRETGLEVIADKTKDMVMSRDQNTEPSHNITYNNKSCEKMEE